MRTESTEEFGVIDMIRLQKSGELSEEVAVVQALEKSLIQHTR